MSELAACAGRSILPPRLARALAASDVLVDILETTLLAPIAIGPLVDAYDVAAAARGIAPSTLQRDCLGGWTGCGESLEQITERRAAERVSRNTTQCTTPYVRARLASEASERARATVRRIRDRAASLVIGLRAGAGWDALLAGAREPSFNACLADEAFIRALHSLPPGGKARVVAIEQHVGRVFGLARAAPSSSAAGAEWWAHSALKIFGVAFETLHDITAPLSASRAFAEAGAPPPTPPRRTSAQLARSKQTDRSLSAKNVRALRALLESAGDRGIAHAGLRARACRASFDSHSMRANASGHRRSAKRGAIADLAHDVRSVQALLVAYVSRRYGAGTGAVVCVWARSERDRTGRAVDVAALGIGGGGDAAAVAVECDAVHRAVESAIFSEVRTCIDRLIGASTRARDAELAAAALSAASLSMDELNIPPGLRLDGDHDMRLSGDAAPLSAAPGSLVRAASYEVRAATIGYLPAIQLLRSLPGLRTPRAKVAAVVAACRAVSECVATYYKGRVHSPTDSSKLAIGADQLLPILIFTVLRSMQPPNPPALFAQCEHITTFLDSTMGEEGYCVMSLQIAMAQLCIEGANERRFDDASTSEPWVESCATCSTCGAKAEAGARTCTECGQELR